MSKRISVVAPDRDGMICDLQDCTQLYIKRVVISFPVAKSYRKERAFYLMFEGIRSIAEKLGAIAGYALLSDAQPTDEITYTIVEDWNGHERIFIDWLKDNTHHILKSVMYEQKTGTLTASVTMEALPSVLSRTGVAR